MGTQRPSPKGAEPQFSVHIYSGQTAGWIKVALGIEVGLGPGHIVLDEEQLSSPKKGQSSLIFRPFLLWPNGWMHQDATRYLSPGDFVLDGDLAPSPKRGRSPPNFTHKHSMISP